MTVVNNENPPGQAHWRLFSGKPQHCGGLKKKDSKVYDKCQTEG
jgi:hypothetical protein